MICIPFNETRFISAQAFLSFTKGRHKSLCLKVGRRTKQNLRNQITFITNRTNAGDIVVDHEMIQYEYSRNIVHVIYMHVYSHNVHSPCDGLRSAVGSASDRKSRVMSLCPSQDT